MLTGRRLWNVFLIGSAALVAIVSILPVRAETAPDRVRQDLDIRFGNGRRVLREPSGAQRSAERVARNEIPGLVLRWDGLSGAPQRIGRLDGVPIGSPSAGVPEAIARRFLVERSSLIGVYALGAGELVLSSVVPVPGGGAHVHFIQRLEGLEVFQSHALVNVSGDGSVRSAGMSLFAGSPKNVDPAIDAREAMNIAVRNVYPDRLVPVVVLDPPASGDPSRHTRFDGTGEYAAPPEARLVLFPAAEDLRLAWSLSVAEPSRFTAYLVLVDALDGTLLYRHNQTLYATAQVLDGGDPEPLAEEVTPVNYVVSDIPDAASPTAESPAGWIDGTGTQLVGNNAIGILGHASSPPIDDPTGRYVYAFGSPRAAAVNAWYVSNTFHDWAREHGFDEAHGNFQQDNFGLGGIAGDPLDIVTRAYGGRNNAVFVTSADGGNSSVTMFWTDCDECGDHDGYPENGGDRSSGFAGDVVVHEYGHGVSTRLVGGPNIVCMSAYQPGAMGEGWSDLQGARFYRDPIAASYFNGQRGFNRSTLTDLDYGDVCDVEYCSVHADGMIWSSALWDLYLSLLALDPAGGEDAFDRLLIEGMASTPCEPTYLDGRDAILDADTTLFGGAHHTAIWNVFAARGMGEDAFTFGAFDSSPIAGFAVPASHECTTPATPISLMATPESDNAIRLDYVTAGAAAVEIWREDLDNLLDQPRPVASTLDPSTFVDTTVHGGRTYRYQVVALGAAGRTCSSPASGIADATATGTCATHPVLDPATTAVQDQGGCGMVVSWQPASPGCAGEPVVYNVYRSPRPGVEPSSANLVDRTMSTTLDDAPPEDGQTRYYLVLAQHGTLDDPPDHGDRGPAQSLVWAPAYPASSRAAALSWGFDAGPEGWTVDNAGPGAGWELTGSPVATEYGGVAIAPGAPAGGSGQSWVTGGGPGKSIANDAGPSNELISPLFDGTGGTTLLSFRYWAHSNSPDAGVAVVVSNGTTEEVAMVLDRTTIQSFRTASERSWQRAEVDLATVIAPTPQMEVTFRTTSITSFDEFGIDDVVIDAIEACARSTLAIDGIVIDDGDPGWGNGNGILEPGETARILVTLRNDGSVTAFSPAGTMSSGGGSLIIHDDRVTFADVPPGGTAGSTDGVWTVSLDAGTPCVETVVLRFELEDASGTRSLLDESLELGTRITETVFSDTFETDLGWEVVDPTAGVGTWERAVPVGTTDGGAQANPDADSPNDAGAMCLVTENGPTNGKVDDYDVDQLREALSPTIDLSAFKRARSRLDVWFYDDGGAGGTGSEEDFFNIEAGADDPTGFSLFSRHQEPDTTGGWVEREIEYVTPMVANFRIRLRAHDRGPETNINFLNNTVEAAIDHVRVIADRQECDPTGVTDPPNGVGDSLRATRLGAAASLSWTASPIDETHDGAAYYRLHASGQSSGGFAVTATTTTTGAQSAPGLATEFYLVSAVNVAGESPDTP